MLDLPIIATYLTIKQAPEKMQELAAKNMEFFFSFMNCFMIHTPTPAVAVPKEQPASKSLLS